MQKLFSTFIQDAYRSYCTKRFVFAVLGVAFFNFLSVYWDMLLGAANCVAYLKTKIIRETFCCVLVK